MRIQYNGYHIIGNAYLKHTVNTLKLHCTMWKLVSGVEAWEWLWTVGSMQTTLILRGTIMQGAWELSFHVGRSTTHAVSVHGSCQINSLSFYLYIYIYIILHHWYLFIQCKKGNVLLHPYLWGGKPEIKCPISANTPYYTYRTWMPTKAPLTSTYKPGEAVKSLKNYITTNLHELCQSSCLSWFLNCMYEYIKIQAPN